MRKIIEYTLVSADGVFENAQDWGLKTSRTMPICGTA
jgi:hypothetical protein